MASFPSPIGPSLKPLLLRAGLSEREAGIYQSLLALKTGRVTTIAKAAKQSRSHTYLVLRSLEEKGLVSHIERGKILHFVAEKPERLLQYAEDREASWKQTKTLLAGAMPYLKSLTPPLADQPRVTTLHGLEGMKQVYRDVLLQPGFCAFFNADVMFRTFGQNVVPLLFGKNERLRGRELFVDNLGARKYVTEVQQDDEYEVRLLPPSMDFLSEMVIYEDTVALFAYDEELSIVKIENKNFADTFRALFEALWAVGISTKKR